LGEPVRLVLEGGEPMYKLYFHVDASENAFFDGEYRWEQALRRLAILLRYYPSVSLAGIRYYSLERR